MNAQLKPSIHPCPNWVSFNQQGDIDTDALVNSISLFLDKLATELSVIAGVENSGMFSQDVLSLANYLRSDVLEAGEFVNNWHTDRDWETAIWS